MKPPRLLVSFARGHMETAPVYNHPKRTAAFLRWLRNPDNSKKAKVARGEWLTSRSKGKGGRSE